MLDGPVIHGKDSSSIPNQDVRGLLLIMQLHPLQPVERVVQHQAIALLPPNPFARPGEALTKEMIRFAILIHAPSREPAARVIFAILRLKRIAH